jgi:predicted DNA-binding ArsR family transcriptional regulator
MTEDDLHELLKKIIEKMIISKNVNITEIICNVQKPSKLPNMFSAINRNNTMRISDFNKWCAVLNLSDEELINTMNEIIKIQGKEKTK